MSHEPPPGEGTATLAREVAARPLDAVVRVLDASARPAAFRLGSSRCLVGAGPGCDVVVDDPTVSRKHVSLEVVAEGVAVTDLESRNGTFYLGQRVAKVTLSLGSRIKVGAATIALDADLKSLASTELYDADEYRGIIGTSVVMRRMFATLQRLEGALVSVLVTGESGVGKELVATALHQGSSVTSGPNVVVNCGAIPRELVASELFGHKRGAFKGAVESRRGAFALADGGTIFLDEVGELPLEIQPVLLRVLETGEVRPVGGEGSHVKVRVVAATNRDLEEEVRAGRFRDDLYYRLAVVQVVVPPLRDRIEDVEALARRFAKAAGAKELPDDVVEQLRQRTYPGNVRQLRNVIQAWVALGALPESRSASRGGKADVERFLSETVDVTVPYAEQKERFTDAFTRVYLKSLLAHTGGNQTRASKLAGIDRTHFGRLVVKYGLGKS